MKKITVLGAGLVGSAIIKDLAEEYSITAVDLNQKLLDKLVGVPNVISVQANLREPGKVEELVADSDLVVSAVPGFMGFETLKRIIESEKDVVDIAFFPEEALELDALAKEKGVTVIVDAGVAPGLCNIMAGYLDSQLDQVNEYLCFVGGLPKTREWPYEYKAVFSPADVLEEYTRPARYVAYGEEVIRPALSEVELIDFPGVGTLEAFNTDGIRSLIRTLDAPFMKEKTLRYPGHTNLMRIFRESGFFSQKAIEVDGQKVVPLSLTSKLMFKDWELKEGEADFTVMQVDISGSKGGKKEKHSFYLLDEYDNEKQVTSMARTTGYTCSILARQVLKGLFSQKGICPPEFVGRTEGCYEDLISEYEKRNILITETITKE
jgi:lysine 6-dehydrogenase